MEVFCILNEEIGELTEKQDFLAAVIEMIKPSSFITAELCWIVLRRPMKKLEYVLRSFILKAGYDYSMTKMLIENLKTNSSLRMGI